MGAIPVRRYVIYSLGIVLTLFLAVAVVFLFTVKPKVNEKLYLSKHDLSVLTERANSGDVSAARRIWMYYDFYELDENKSIEWMKKCAELGDNEAIMIKNRDYGAKVK